MLLAVLAIFAANCFAEHRPHDAVGKSITIDEAPWIVWYGRDCGGTLISDEWVLTAAHCKKLRFVKVGSTTDSIRDGEIIPILKHYVHPNYNSTTQEYDYRLVMLKRKISERADLPGPAPRNRAKTIEIGDDSLIKPGANITIAGWGGLTESGERSSTLKSVTIPIADQQNCRDVMKLSKVTSGHKFCAGIREGSDDNKCYVDHGGPVTIDGKLVGLATWGHGCGTHDKFGVFSKVSYVSEWIAKIIESNDGSKIKKYSIGKILEKNEVKQAEEQENEKEYED